MISRMIQIECKDSWISRCSCVRVSGIVSTSCVSREMQLVWQYPNCYTLWAYMCATGFENIRFVILMLSSNWKRLQLTICYTLDSKLAIKSDFRQNCCIATLHTAPFLCSLWFFLISHEYSIFKAYINVILFITSSYSVQDFILFYAINM